jgi:UDP-glucoronosyl and UDP-glucosyl transferase
LWTRFYNNYIFGAKLLWAIQNICSEKIALQQELGISSKQVLPHKIQDSVKLVNNFFGMEPARPLGPLVRFSGPILSSSYPTLDVRNAEFLDAHERVAYVAFGHHSVSAPHELQNLWLALIDSVEANTLDGFLWVIRDTSNFPKIVTSTLGTKVNVSDVINNRGKYPHYLFSEWAPQFAVLSHPSTTLFITHGGANSLFESLYIGKKMLFHPYFGDQGTNVEMLEKSGVGLVYDRFTSNAKDMSRKIKLIVEDEDGQFARNMRRMSALVQLKAAEAIPNAISTIEEVIFSSDMDEVPHLYPASRNMTFIKANNIDLQFILLCLAFTFCLLTYSTGRALCRVLYKFSVSFSHFTAR